MRGRGEGGGGDGTCRGEGGMEEKEGWRRRRDGGEEEIEEKEGWRRKKKDGEEMEKRWRRDEGR